MHTKPNNLEDHTTMTAGRLIKDLRKLDPNEKLYLSIDEEGYSIFRLNTWERLKDLDGSSYFVLLPYGQPVDYEPDPMLRH